MADIRILGAGISGLAAAINLARAGYPVDVYERNSDCGRRFLGDMQGIDNYYPEKDVLVILREMNIETNFQYYPLDRMVLTNCVIKKNIGPLKRPGHYLVKRGPEPGTLDQGLKEQALAAGVRLHFNEAIPETDADIVATGPLGRSLAGIAKGIVFKTKKEDMAVTVCNDALAYKGYSYLLIREGYGCMVSVVFGDFKKIGGCFDATRKYFIKDLSLDIKDPGPVGGVGCFSIGAPLKKGKTLYIGEAAGLQDFVAGFGMLFAFRSGYLAARCIIEGKDYASAAELEFWDQRRTSVVNRYVYERFLRHGNYTILIELLSLSSRLQFDAYNRYGLMHKLTYPFALKYLKKRYPQIEARV
ncbi:MAG: NAD(P)-binding protein [Candidatus Altiarchaeia archaeon]